LATDTRTISDTPAPRLGRKAQAQINASRDLRPLARLVPFVLRYRSRVLLTILFLLVSALAQLVIPFIAGRIIDKGFVEKNLVELSQYGWIVIGVAAVMAVASGSRFFAVSVLGERVLTDLRHTVFDHLLLLDATFYDTHRVGELTSRLNGDVATIRGAIGSTLSMTLRSTITIIGAVTMMFVTSWWLALAVVIIAPIFIIPVIMLGRRLRRMSRRTQDALAELSAMATEVLGSSKAIKSFGQEPIQSQLYSDRAEDSFQAEVTRLRARAFMIGGISFLVVVGLVLMVWWGARAVVDGNATAGQLAQFMIYALMATNSLTSISEVMGSLQTVSGATERLVEILDTKPGIVAQANPVPMPVPPLGRLAFDHVGFSYETRDDESVLTDLSFTVNRGETVALVGASGAGKTTVFALTQRFYDATTGRVLVDGLDVRTVTPADLRRHFAYVEQDPTIFAGTVADNIRFGKPDATDAEIQSAARAALVHDFVSALPNGYASIVGERGVMLSGGQKQRVAIARALLKDAPILLLDEATSALDAESERLVQIALERLMHGRTTLVIAHRLATIRHADRILVLDHGQLIDQGTHDELVLKGGRYAELARLQFGIETPRAAE
jgi:ATP-binding cassette, subfamily B, bacterial